MPTPISPKSKKILDEIRGLSAGTGRGTPVTPQSKAILDEIRGLAQPLPQPAPIQLEAPAPTRPQNPNVQYGPSGRVVDPTTGQEFGGAAHENPPQPTDTRALEAGLTTAKDYVFKPLTMFRDPAVAALNAAADRGLAEEARGGPLAGAIGVFKGLLLDAPAAAVKAIGAPPQKDRFIAEPLRRMGSPNWLAETAQIGISTFFVDPPAARLWGGMMGLAGAGGRKLAAASGLLDKPIPGVGKSARVLEGEARLRGVAKQAFVKGDALAGQLRREGDQVLKRVEGVYNGYRERGVDFARTTADGRRVNAADELVSDWIEAGTPGAKFASRSQAEAAAPGVGLEVNDLRDLGATISRTYRKSGLWLEQVGFLKPGTVQNFGGRYVARLYHVASHNPGDVEAALKVADELGAVSPQATELANRVLQKAARGGFGVGKERSLTEFGAREGYLAERQAGVTLGSALPRQARAGARGAALQQISQNPELFSAAEHPGWIQAKVGPVEGYFHPVAYDMIRQVTKTETPNAAAKLLQSYAGKVKGAWASYNPAVQVGNIKQNIALAEGAAAARGLHWNAIRDLIPDLKAYKNALQNPGSDPFFEALAQRSRAFTGESGQLGEVGSSLRNAIGIDTAGQRLGKAAGRVLKAPTEAFGRVEEVFKYSLFKRLVKGGISEDEAARITDRALFDHTDVDARVAALNKYGIVPFLSTRLKGLENSASIWLKNPDILLRHSGYRAGQTALGIAGSEAQARDRLTNPSGRLRIPVPGLKDKYGRQRFVTGQLFSQNPLEALNPGLNNPFSGGVFSPLVAAAQNYDPFKAEITGSGEVVKPGELPKLDALLQRVKFAVQGTVPTLTPFVGREWERIGRAAGGQTRFGGPSGEPEDLASALLGAMTGTRLVTPETPLEKQQRSTYNIVGRSENQRFLGEYLGARRRGDVQPEVFPEWYFPKEPKEIALQFKNAADKVRNYVKGGEDVPGSLASKAKIRHLADWMMALQERYQKVSMTALDADTLIALSQEGGG